MKKIAGVCVLAIILLLYIFIAGDAETERTVLFLSVKAESKHDSVLAGDVGKNELLIKYKTAAAPLFIVQNNELYLRIQSTWNRGMNV